MEHWSMRVMKALRFREINVGDAPSPSRMDGVEMPTLLGYFKGLISIDSLPIGRVEVSNVALTKVQRVF